LHSFEYAEEHDLIDQDTSEFDLAVLKGCVKDALEALPQIYRDIYNACELNEKSVVEAAKELNITHNAAKSRLLRARMMVRDLLDRSICAA
jgi:DNA-directed RNA polymerase specialized sigma24 family protein